MIRTVARLSILAFALPRAGASARGTRTFNEAYETGIQTFPHESFMVAWIPLEKGYTIDQAGGYPLPEDLTPTSWALGKAMSAAEKKPVTLVIAGPESAESRKALVAATQLVHHMLPHLRVLFLGDSQDLAIVRFAVEKVGGEIVDPSLN